MSEPMYCGAVESTTAVRNYRRDPFLCTEPCGHPGPHIASVDGELVASWKPAPDDEFYPKETR